MILKGLEGEQPLKKKGKSHFELIGVLSTLLLNTAKENYFSQRQTLKTACLTRQVT